MWDLDWYRGKRILITGHTGFKGTWLCKILLDAGAEVTGFALPPEGDPSLFDLAAVRTRMRSILGDIRDLEQLKAAFDAARPELVFHLAAQPIVRASYEDPVRTFETNVMGTVHVCECVRTTPGVRSFLNVTTDKVYEDREQDRGYRETDPLGGHDPYATSKACSELVTQSYVRSFLRGQGIAVSTVRAGNVIGGGDFSRDRIVPDCIRAAVAGRPILVRNPRSIRPYQHVLEPLFAYLMIAQGQYKDDGLSGAYNVGPDDHDVITTGRLASLFCESWGGGVRWETRGEDGPHEASVLRLDCSRLERRFGWRPRWDVATAVEKTVEWTRTFLDSPADVPRCMERQIGEFLDCGEEARGRV